MSKEGFQSLMRKMEEFARANDRISVPERRRAVISLYRRLRCELAGEAKTGVRETGGFRLHPNPGKGRADRVRRVRRAVEADGYG